MTYQALDTVPAFETVQADARGLPLPASSPDVLRWANKAPPPPVGAEIVVTVNGCGPAVVTGYFSEDGFLGVRCDLTAPPEWFIDQNKGKPGAHAFGTEFRLALHPLNEARAVRARAALDAYALHADGIAWGRMGKADKADALSDLVANLGHLAQIHGFDFSELVERGREHYAHESAANYQGD